MSNFNYSSYSMDSLVPDVIRIILSLTNPRDVINYSMTSKKNLKYLRDIPLWLHFCVTRTRFSRKVFFELVAGEEEMIIASHNPDFDQRYPFNPTSNRQLIVGGNLPCNVFFVMMRRHNCRYEFRTKMGGIILCRKLTMPGSAYCRTCHLSSYMYM